MTRAKQSPTRATEVSESDFQQTVIQLAKLNGWLVYHDRRVQVRRKEGSEYWTTPMAGDPGYPDLTLARRGRVIFAELKSEKGKPSDAQLGWLVSLPNSYVWRPSDWDSIVELLAKGA